MNVDVIKYDSTVNYKNEKFSYIYSNILIGYLNSTPKIKDVGSFLIIINSNFNDGPNGTFCISKSKKEQYGNISKLSYSQGDVENLLELEWNPYEYPKLFLKRKISNDEYYKSSKKEDKKTLTFEIKIV